jgi:hypothetical protein
VGRDCVAGRRVNAITCLGLRLAIWLPELMPGASQQPINIEVPVSQRGNETMPAALLKTETRYLIKSPSRGNASYDLAHWMWYREVLLSATFPLVAPPVFLNLLIKLNSSLIQRQGPRLLGYPMRKLIRTGTMKGWIVSTKRKCVWMIGFKCCRMYFLHFVDARLANVRVESDIAAWVVSCKYRSSHGLECISGLVPSPVSPCSLLSLMQM